MRTVAYLHFTDLHFGLTPQGWLWPHFRTRLYEDLRKMIHRSGPWELVLFSGDFVQSGGIEEYKKLSEELDKLWSFFAELGCRPMLVCTPGNHDLVRPSPHRPAVKVLRQWFDDPEVAETFWRDEACEYRQVVSDAFTNYQSWFESVPVPTLRAQYDGILPGDSASIFEGKSIKLGIVTLNSTFLQLTGDDYEGQLAVDTRQLHAVTGGDPDAWCSQADLCFILTHQNTAWLHPRAQTGFRAEIYPPGRFFAQFCGHLHSPDSRETREAGAEMRRLRQGTSLFGLEKWGQTTEQRLHGYAIARIELDQAEGTERVWPRIARLSYAGNWGIVADTGYELEDDDSVATQFDTNRVHMGESADHDTAIPNVGHSASQLGASDATQTEPVATDAVPDWSLVAVTLDEASARAKLRNLHRVRYFAESQHLAVRKEEQSRLELALREKRAGWVISDWGMGRDNFLGCVLARLGLNERHADVFRLRCEDVENIDSLLTAFDVQFSRSFGEFFGSLSVLGNSCLVLEGVPEKLTTTTFGDNQSEHFHEIIATVLDYAPKLNIILNSRQRPQSSPYACVELKSFELLEVRDYLNNHPKATNEALELEGQELLYERSGGLPIHLDRLLPAISATSLGEVLQDELETDIAELDQLEPMPKALTQAVASLTSSSDKYSGRSLKLLKLLTVLSSGETLESIKRFYHTEPFQYHNVTQLVALSLLEVIPVQLPFADVANSSSSLATPKAIPKLLKVPRQVRDYVRSNTTEAERSEILTFATDKFFGRNWRDGRVKLRQTYTLEINASSGVILGNERTVANHLLWKSLQKGDRAPIKRAARLSIDFAAQLEQGDRYRDLHQVAHDFLNLLEGSSVQFPHEVAQMAAKDALALRMLGRYQEALIRLNQSLGIEGGLFSNSDFASAYMEMAHIYVALDDSISASEAARLVLQYASKDSGHYIQASELIAKQSEDDETFRKTMKHLLQVARVKGLNITASNLALSLAARTVDADEALALYNSVLSSKDDNYNVIRAAISKAHLLGRLDRMIDLTRKDKRLLGASYTYTHAQRLSSLFDRAHGIIWQLFASQPNALPALAALYRHSSFLWRVRGESERELPYLQHLETFNSSLIDTKNSQAKLDLDYLRKRQAVLRETSQDTNMDAEKGGDAKRPKML